MMAAPANKSGFTLIELMVVVILVGIFSGLMIGEMRGTYEDALLRSAARKIIEAANLANSKAVTQSRIYSLRLEPSENRFSIRADGERDAVEQEKLDSRIQLQVRDGAVQSEEDPAQPRAERERELRALDIIQFRPDGTADNRDILLRDRTGVEVILRINPATARIRVVEDEVSL